MVITYTIPLDPRTKKNHQMIAGVGRRCPTCKKPIKQFIRQGSASSEYVLRASGYMWPKPETPISTPVQVKYVFYMATKRKVDLLNLQAQGDDLLVSAGILADDNSNIVKSHDGSRVRYDKYNPRTEITITDYKEDDQ